MTSPTPGTTLASSTVDFQWSAGSGVDEYWLGVGTSAANVNGSSSWGDIFAGSTGTNTSQVVTGIPINGDVVYVRLWWDIGGDWSFVDYIYPTQSAGGGGNQTLQPVQREYTATGTNVAFDIGTFTVPPSKMLVIELVTIKVPTSTSDYALSVTTTVDGTTVIHSVGNVHKTDGNYGGYVFQSFPVTLYADPDTNVIFSSVPRGISTTFHVTFSGKLVDAP